MNKGIKIEVEIQIEDFVNVAKELEKFVSHYLAGLPFCTNGFLSFPKSKKKEDKSLFFGIKSIRIQLPFDMNIAFHFEIMEYNLLFYKITDEEPEQVLIDQEEGIKGLNYWLIPNAKFDGLWDSLYFHSSIKNDLLNFLTTTLFFAKQKVDMSVINWNKLVLLYGPPGTGKTSLAKSLAQKACIRFSKLYSYGYLVEVSAHSLFSKFFSESGKQVKKVFQKIHELLEEDDAIVFVLIDEVESLAGNRKKSIEGNEPSDAIRAVNAFLTQLDQLKYAENVVVLTTSNLEHSVDDAYADRADIKQYIGNPSSDIIYRIICDCIEELIKKKIIIRPSKKFVLQKSFIPTYDELNLIKKILASEDENKIQFDIKILLNVFFDLFNLCTSMSGKISGRFIRKIPFLTYVFFFNDRSHIRISDFVEAIGKTVKRCSQNSSKEFL